MTPPFGWQQKYAMASLGKQQEQLVSNQEIVARTDELADTVR
jgi:hypothetical protein